MQKPSATILSSKPALTKTNSGLHDVSKVSNTSAIGTTGGDSTQHISSETEKKKKEQKNKLTYVKQQTVAVVTIVDLVLIVALIYQLTSLNSSLREFMSVKTTNMLGLYNFKYNERLNYLVLGSGLYQSGPTAATACRALQSDSDAIAETHRQLRYEQSARTIEIAALLNNTAGIVTSAGPESANGQIFDVGGLVTDYMTNHGTSGDTFRDSVMLDRHHFERFNSPDFGVAGDDRNDLAGWRNYSQTLTRVVLAPLYCGSAQPQGFIMFGDSVTPRQYNIFAPLLTNTNSAMGGILARSTDSVTWQTTSTYIQAGSYGAHTQFPDLVQIFSRAFLDQVGQSAAGTVFTGDFTYESVPYTYSMSAISTGHTGNGTVHAKTSAVYVYAEPLALVTSTVHAAMSWQIPFIVLLIIWSCFILSVIFRKFINPMQGLIDSVKTKKMKEFNDWIRKLKANQSAIWQLLLKVTVSEAILLALIFVNRNLLDSVSSEFSSAKTEGKVLSSVYSSNAYSKLQYLAAWSAESGLVSAVADQNASAATLSAALQHHYDTLQADAIAIIDLNGDVRASTYTPSIGTSFPEPRITQHYLLEKNADARVPFLSHTAWDPETVNVTTPGLRRGPNDVPVLTQLIVAPIRNVTLSGNDLVYGEFLGALVIVQFLNGGDSNWPIEAFSPGYFGLYLWNVYDESFMVLTSVLKKQDSLQWKLDVTSSNPDLLPNGIMSLVVDDNIVVANNVAIDGQSYTASVVPFRGPDEVVLSPMVANAYLVRGLSQAAWDAVQSTQLRIQIVNMVIVVLSLITKLVLSYLPLRRFLNILEKTFQISSLSADKAAKRELAAAAILKGGPVMKETKSTASSKLNSDVLGGAVSSNRS